MKKKIASLLAFALILSAASCGNSAKPAATSEGSSETKTEAVSEATSAQETPETSAHTETSAVTTSAAVTTVVKPYNIREEDMYVLENKMTECERLLTKKRDFSLTGDYDTDKPTVAIGAVHIPKEVLLDQIEKFKEFTDEEEYNSRIASAEAYTYRAALVNGIEYFEYIPEDGYDGGAFSDGVQEYADMEEFFEKMTETYNKEYGYSYSDSVDMARQARFVFDAVINRTYIELPQRIGRHLSNPSSKYHDPKADYRSKWTLSADNVDYIKAYTDEYTVYDEELNMNFVVHVTTPPNYDRNKYYPVLFMTDSVWRFNDHADMYRLMENNEMADVILVSLGYDYTIDGTENFTRNCLFILERRALLTFITDNLMPYLGENYKIDYADSTLFGHSMGGVFTHCALCESDKYENQPFGKYIIASPAFWNLYSDYPGLDPECIDTDYGYFDRNEKLDKKVSLYGGSLEDPDYADSYAGHDSTLEGIRKLNDRLTSHGADVTYKLYESHHYQYVAEMLIEYLKAEYLVG